MNTAQTTPAAASRPLFSKMLDFLRKLREQKLAFTLRHSRDDAIMVQINVPGERWEVEFLEDGDVDVEVFRSNGEIHDESWIEKLLNEQAD